MSLPFQRGAQSSSAVKEKRRSLSQRIPSVPSPEAMASSSLVRRVRASVHHFFYPPGSYQRLGLSRSDAPPRLSLARVLAAFGAVFVLVGLYYTLHRSLPPQHTVPFPMSEPSTKVLDDRLIERIWRWEIAAGRYPSTEKPLFEFAGPLPQNPGVPRNTSAPGSLPAVGRPRAYLDAPATPHVRAYPPRPPPAAALDLDVIMAHCDFSRDRYVRDCLELLRTNLGTDPGVRRGDVSAWRALYLRESGGPALDPRPDMVPANMTRFINDEDGLFEELVNVIGNRTALSPYDAVYPPVWGGTSDGEHSDAENQLLERSGVSTSPKRSEVPGTPPNISLPASALPPLAKRDSFSDGYAPSAPLPSPAWHVEGPAPLVPHYPAFPGHPTADPACPPSNPHVFHVFWAGPFTDKPYLMAMSFLYTQRLELQRSVAYVPADVCRPQLWIWINPGPASSVPDPSVIPRMRRQLKNNPWSAPFLHDRFKDVIKFKLWNTTEQLDSIPEMVGWRNFELFNSGGVKYGGPKAKAEAFTFGEDDGDAEGADAAETADPNAPAIPVAPGATAKKKKSDALFNRVGSKDASEYDRLSVVLSDMARFVLTHRFGGIYLDADTILLQDWTPLFQTPQQFAYRWSRLQKYNTAVLKLARGSAVGSFIFRSAIGNGGMDFHPMTVSKYTRDAEVAQLLLRLPDALFDPAWLNTEYYQRDRPPFPYFKRFEDFFDPPKDNSASPLALGFDGFFKGAFSYHFHNFWWIAFDKARNFPDLGARFSDIVAQGKQLAIAQAIAAQEGSDSERARTGLPIHVKENEPVEKDTKDLPWSAVLKRTFEAYVRGERPNMYGEFINWD